MMEDFNLNKEQLEAVKTVDGPVMVFAGAGTGKTKTLISRVIYMIKEAHIIPYRILAITFTKKATNEMRERLNNSLDIEVAKQVNVSTIHALCARILRMNYSYLGYSRNFEIIDDDDAVKLMGDVFKKLKLDRKTISPKSALKMISDIKNGIGTKTYIITPIIDAYQAYLKENNMVDFDDLLLLTLQLFENNTDVLSYYRKRFEYLLVDEFQDTNEVQGKIIKMLAAPLNNLFVVGDDDQSIYSFRGANIKNMLDFTKEYKNAKVIKLVQNYRSTNVILKGANEVIRHNKTREPKELYSLREGTNKDVIIQEAYSYEDEAKYVTNEIIHLVEHGGYQYKDIAVIYRNNAISRPFELTFIENRIPYNIYGGYAFLKRREIKDIISYLRFILDDTKIVHFERIINLPPRGIGDKTLKHLKDRMEENNCSLFDSINLIHNDIPSSKMNVLESFKTMILELEADIETKSLPLFFDEIMEKTGYLENLQKEDNETQDRVNNAKEFRSVLVNMETSYENSDFSQREKLYHGLDEILLDQSYGEDEDTEGVVLSTVHSIKGLEFRCVFVVALEEGIFPASREEVDVEEERRVAYVAFTRAKDKIYLTSSRRRLIYGRSIHNKKSRFILEYVKANTMSTTIDSDTEVEIPFDPEDIKLTDKVEHAFFGRGIVIALEDKYFQIMFDKDHTIRKISKSFDKMKKIVDKKEG